MIQCCSTRLFNQPLFNQPAVQSAGCSISPCSISRCSISPCSISRCSISREPGERCGAAGATACPGTSDSPVGHEWWNVFPPDWDVSECYSNRDNYMLDKKSGVKSLHYILNIFGNQSSNLKICEYLHTSLELNWSNSVKLAPEKNVNIKVISSHRRQSAWKSGQALTKAPQWRRRLGSRTTLTVQGDGQGQTSISEWSMRCQTITRSIFGAQKWYTPFWNSQSKAFGVNSESSAHLNLLSIPERPPSYHLGGCNPSAEEPGNEQMDVHLKLLLQCSICSLNECPMIKMYSNK